MSEQSTEKPRWRRLVKRTLLWLALGLAGLLVLVVSTALVVRLLIYNDERLREMAVEHVAAKTGAEVELAALDISLLHGIELGPLRIGPLPGFEHDTVAFDRLAVRWDLFDLVFLELTVHEVALEGVDFTLEENEEAGRNLDALLLSLTGPPSEVPEEPEPEPEPEEPRPLEQPSLPVAVVLERLAVSVNSVHIDRPDLDLAIDRIGLDGTFAGEGQSMDLDLWVGLGERAEEGAPSVLTLSGESLPGDVRVEQRFGVAVASTGFGDIQVELDWDADGEVEGLPPVELNTAITVAANLLTQSAELSQFLIGLGELTRIELVASAQELLETPRVHVDTLELSTDIGELSPMAAAFVPGLAASGELHLSAEPFDALASPSAATTTDVNLALLLSAINVELADAGIDVRDLELGVQALTEGGNATLTLEADLPRARVAKQTIRGLELGVSARAPIAPWLGGEPEGEVDASLDLRVRHGGGAAGRGSGVRLSVEAKAPVDLILAGRAEQPLDTKLRLDVGGAVVPSTQLSQARLTLNAQLWDFAAERAEAELGLTVATAIVALGEEDTLRLDNTSLDIDLGRRGQQFDVRELLLSTTDALELELGGVVDRAFTSRPRFDEVSLRVSLLDLERLLALAPASKRPPDVRVGGRADLRVAIDGRLAIPELTRRAQLPEPEGDDMGAQLQAYADYLEGWQAEFRRGMPVVTSVDLSLTDITLEMPNLELAGFSLDYGVTVEKHGPRTTLVLVAERIEPAGLSDVRADFELSFEDGMFGLGLSSTIGRVKAENMVRPVTNVSANLALRYKLGGDLLLDTLELNAPEPGMHLEASGVFSKPLRFVLARGWEQPRLAGLTAALRWNTGVQFGEELRQVVANLPEVAGGASLRGDIRAEEGAIAFDGLLDFDRMHVDAEAQNTRLVDLSGGLPVSLVVSFDPRDDATILRRLPGVGSGVVALVTSGDDIRKRPARPAYYDRLRPYRQRKGLTFHSLQRGDFDIEDFELTGRVTEGMLLVDRLGMHVLGGDVDGNMAVQIGRDASLRTDLSVKFSNIDASYFKVLDVEPGADSELSADMQVGFLAARRGRDLSLDVNVTKIGSDTLDRFLLFLDGGDEEGPMSDIRGYLGLVYLDGVKAWVRYENLNLDLDAGPKLRIPGTSLAYPNIEREILRRFSLTGYLDTYLQPLLDGPVAELLGWREEDDES